MKKLNITRTQTENRDGSGWPDATVEHGREGGVPLSVLPASTKLDSDKTR